MASGTLIGDDSRENYINRKNLNKSKIPNHVIQGSRKTLGTAIDDNQSLWPQNLPNLDAGVASDDSSSSDYPQSGSFDSENGSGVAGYRKIENRVRISLDSCSKIEVRELRRRLISELDQVRCLVKRLEAMEVQRSGCHSQFSANYVADNMGSTMRVNSEVGSVGRADSRPSRGLSASTAENNHGVDELVEKEKKKPKANQTFPESDKKVNSKGGKRDDREVRFGQGTDKYSTQLFKSCNNLLEKLMKHKFGWVFNKPVDAKALGLHDYNIIVKHPMDLGTVRTRLDKTFYKSPMEFAEDVRLTFRNAMLYNPKGQDVHIMAEQLLKLFEEKWVTIESQFNLNRSSKIGDDSDYPRPTSRKVQGSAASASPPSPPVVTTLERQESATKPVDPELMQDRTPVSKKPKANDSDKRDMTMEEKQRLKTSLENLPSEKLENVVLIINKRNPGLCEQDEIVVDIGCFDPETLWDLDRYVTNYKKSLSKKKRKAEVALLSRNRALSTAEATRENNA
ncbi:hypothetical protein UlMin_027612, partial [Ulmus minor]